MAKLVYVTQEMVRKGRKKHERLIVKDDLWQEEQQMIKQVEAEEKSRRDAEYAALREAEQSVTEN